MKITIYELLGLIKEGKAPKKIDYYGDIYVFAGDDYSLNDERERWFITQYDYVLAKFMQEEVEVIEEEKEIEFEDIKELGNNFTFENTNSELEVRDFEKSIISKKINSLIKNQKKIIDVINDMRDKE